MRRASVALGFAFIAAFVVGCEATTRTAGPPGYSTPDSLEAEMALRDDVDQLCDYLEARSGEVAHGLQTPDTPAALRTAAQRLQLAIYRQTNDVASKLDPREALLELWALALRLESYVATPAARATLGRAAPDVDAVMREFVKRVEAAAARHIKSDELGPLRAQLVEYAAVHPITSVDSFAPGEDFTQPRVRGNVLAQVFQAPFVAAEQLRRGLDPTASLARSVDRLRELMEDYPVIVRWQLQLALTDAVALPEVAGALATTERFTAAFERVSASAENLPSELRELIDDVLANSAAQQRDFRTLVGDARDALSATERVVQRAEQLTANTEPALAELQRTLAAAERITVALRATAPAVEAVIEAFDAYRAAEAQRTAASPRSAPDAKPFDIDAYAAAAEQMQALAAELRGLVGDLDEILAERRTAALSERVDRVTTAALAPTEEAVRALVDRAAWRGVQLIGLIFALAIIYRFIAKRITQRDTAPRHSK